MLVPIEDISANPNQPRRSFDEEKLAELAASIASQGVLQPILVRRHPNRPGFEIIAGERRWRAAQVAQLHELPVIVKEFDDETLMQVAIIENIQRADLSPIEEARGFRSLIDRFGHTQEHVAQALGKSRSYIANALRLLTLPPEVLDMVSDGRLSSGHARALVTHDAPAMLAREIVAKGLNVREVEDIVRNGKPKLPGPGKTGAARRGVVEKDPDTLALEMDLALNLGMGVSIYHEPGGERGTLKITYNTLDDLDRLCRVLSSIPRDLDF